MARRRCRCCARRIPVACWRTSTRRTSGPSSFSRNEVSAIFKTRIAEARPRIIAEISGEHLGKFGNAAALIRSARDAGADAAKLQCFDPERLAERRGGKNRVLKDGLWAGRSLLDLYRETHTPREWFPDLFAYAEEIGIDLFSSVFDADDIAFLETLDCPAYKISARESDDIELIDRAVNTGKQVIISLPPDAAVTYTIKGAAYLHCVSEYPAEDARLDRLEELLAELPNNVVGFSDHTRGIGAAIMATHLGARIIEKHITLQDGPGGPDAAFSLRPDEFSRMVTECRLCR